MDLYVTHDDTERLLFSDITVTVALTCAQTEFINLGEDLVINNYKVEIPVPDDTIGI